jgi:hypothetical protein
VAGWSGGHPARGENGRLEARNWKLKAKGVETPAWPGAFSFSGLSDHTCPETARHFALVLYGKAKYTLLHEVRSTSSCTRHEVQGTGQVQG